MTKQKISKKHHYIPRKYLSWFSDDKNNFYVYDKIDDKIFKSSPDNSFFKNKLNTIEVNWEENDELEKIYSNWESLFWSSYNNIINSNHKESIKLEDKFELFLFLNFLFWRLPTNQNLVDNISRSDFEKIWLNYFKIEDKTNTLKPEVLKEMIKKMPQFNKMLKIILPMAPYYNKWNNWNNSIDSKFLYTSDNKPWYFIWDNPIILEEDKINILNPLENCIIPISSKILMFSWKEFRQENFKESFIIQFNTAILHNSKRFVAFQNRSFLEAIIKDYKLHKKYKKEDTIIPELIKLLKKYNWKIKVKNIEEMVNKI